MPAGPPCTPGPVTRGTVRCVRRRSRRWRRGSGSWRTRCGRRPPTAWFSINAFFVSDNEGGRRPRNWYVNFEHPTRRGQTGFDTLDLAVDLVITPDLARWAWKPTWPTPRLPRPTAATEGVVPS
ncbi:DUF402 domain-containing protein [Streptomyces sp. NPDC093071]|uniref:DUF402 domain-containing protein n=1 Tax=Streptomyces sp. NPDC093071 TaxID=3366022 RepID=UPI003824BA27